MIFTGEQIVAELTAIEISHVIWIPDSELGQWEADLEAAPCELIRICREGEAWPMAAGLLLAGKRPLVVMQTTGLFESGDALRNVVHDLQLPVFALIGARNWLRPNSTDSARLFAQPVLDAWELPYELIASANQRERLGKHYRHCRETNSAGAILLGESI